MSTAPARRPSTLSVARAQAAARPLGAIVPMPASPKPIVPERSVARPVVPGPARTQTAAPSRSTLAKAHARETSESTMVIVLVAAFVVFALVLGSMRVVRSSEEGRAREELGQTFAVVHRRQSEFRSIFGRFATWPELRDRGMVIGPRQSVRDWNATISHWFLSIRDVDTGMICDRTGEVFDESAGEREPVCRPMR